MSETKKDIMAEIIINIFKNNIIIRRKFDDNDKFKMIGESVNIINALSFQMVDNMKYYQTIYYYFDSKYREQCMLNMELSVDILCEKYPNNTINKLLKNYL